ncbi:MAG TPA: gephyrin-like molybdotransferase Glp, partial [Cryptosporangiaceae bacterium]|nr:gephyrin-like molybdotransferase Glp [Cryptosporangiaceae bacterium]
VPTDWTDGGRASVLVSVVPAPGHGIRRTGETVAAGAVLTHAGTEVGPGVVGLLAAAGVGTVSVLPQPRVVVVATGDELVAAGQPSAPGRVVDVNSYLLTAAARDAGAKADRLPPLADDDEALRGLVEDQASRTDLIVVTGGTGTGPGDVTRRLFGKIGEVEFVTPAMHPEAVIGFGRFGADRTPVACLPGDPVGALVGFEVLVRPLLQRLAGAENPFRPSVKARLEESVVSPHGVREFRPAYVTERRGGGYTVAPLAGGHSFLAGYATANGLLVLGERVAELRSGSTVDVLLFDRSR